MEFERPLSPSELRNFSSKQFDAYFEQFARFRPDAPASTAYGIQVGNRFLYAPETHLLKEKFLTAVRNQNYGLS